MNYHLDRELEHLSKLFISFTLLVEENFSDTYEALMNNDSKIAQKVIDRDRAIDLMEIQIEEECLKILALHQPVSKDLRYIISILKINNDMERIGDLSSNISERVLAINKLDKESGAFLIPKMGKVVKEMLKNSFDSVIHKNIELARKVLIADTQVDHMHSQMYDLVYNELMDLDKKYFKTFNQYISMSRFLERIADHTTNIAEDLIYMIDGTIIRHNNLTLFDKEEKK